MIKILIADNNKIFCEILRCILQAEFSSIQIEETTGGENIFAIIEQIRPDLLIMDISLPGMSCVASVKKVKERFPDLPIAFLSECDDSRELETAGEAGTGWVFSKSNVTINSIFMMVNSVIKASKSSIQPA